MNIEIHPVIVPETVGIIRDLRTNIRHVDSKPLTEEDIAQYDFRTIFYDVFFNPENTRLYAIGPTLLNFKRELPISELKINNVPVCFELIDINPKTTVLEVNLEQNVILTETNKVTIEFGEQWTWSRSIKKNQLLNISHITLSTIQKDNEIRWIRDWIRYYRNEHDVGTVVIYDNNSEYQDTLEERLALQNTDLFVVNWNFPYGPAKSHGNQLCQLGSLNHCRLKFGRVGYCLNFDIDELLVMKSGSLEDLLSDRDIVYFDSFMVPPVSQLNEDYSFCAFPLRDKLSRIQEGRYQATKYAYRFSGIYANSVHFAVTSRQAKWNMLAKVLKRLKLDRYLTDWLDSRHVVSVETGYYLHYSAITSGWKSSDRFDIQADTSSLVEDLSVVEVLKSTSTKSF